MNEKIGYLQCSKAACCIGIGTLQRKNSGAEFKRSKEELSRRNSGDRCGYCGPSAASGKRIQFFSYGVNPKLFPVAFFLDPVLAGICGALFGIRNQS